MSAHSSALLAALRNAGEDGLHESEVAFIAGRWWRNRISELCRARNPIGEHNGRYFLIDVGRDPGTPVDGKGVLRRPVGVSSSDVEGDSQLVLLDVAPVGTGHYNLDEAA